MLSQIVSAASARLTSPPVIIHVARDPVIECRTTPNFSRIRAPIRTVTAPPERSWRVSSIAVCRARRVTSRLQPGAKQEQRGQRRLLRSRVE
jgi:hypothetical protein